MREIHFNIWDGKNMIVGFDPQYLGDYYFGIGKGVDFDPKDESSDPKKWVWLQYTGCRMVNTDMAVFEGHIIKTPDGHIGKIVFGMKVYHTDLGAIEINGWLFHRLSDGHLETLDYSILKGEYLGNVYENPELLS